MATTKHACAVRGCTRARGAEQIMCRAHWYLVPKPLRDRVWSEYRQRQGSEAHLAAIRDAVRSVNNLLDEQLLTSGESHAER